MSGVEGYVESAASGLLAGRNAAALVLGEPPSTPPRTTAIGALAYYVSHAEAKYYQPSNITFGIMAPLEASGRRAPKGADRKRALSERALADLDAWMAPDARGGRPVRRPRPRAEDDARRIAQAAHPRLHRVPAATTATSPITPPAPTRATSSSS